MRNNYTKEDIKKLVKENNVRFISLQFTDIFGSLKNVAITDSQLDKALDNQCMFDGSSIEGFTRINESDMYLYPDINTFQILPWSTEEHKTARFICNVHKSDKGRSPFEGDPRQILIRALNRAKDMGYTFNVGPECEFFLFKTDENGNPSLKLHDDAGYFDMSTVDNGDSIRNEMCSTLEEMGFEIEASHHEVASTQHEIDFKYAEVLETADNIMTFKLIVKLIAKQNGLHATFMPKPIFGINGSGMHINVSLSNISDGKNVFFDESDEIGLSTIARSFIAGVMSHAKGITAVANPLVNSYKRLLPGYEAPVYIAWGAQNRSPLVRIPASRGVGTRMELRSPDPSANPYLALATILHAGLDGVEAKMTPPTPVESNIYKMSAEERAEKGIESLPATLREALECMEKDPLIKKALGDHAYDAYLQSKRVEWEDYRTKVHGWEIDEYLNKY